MKISLEFFDDCGRCGGGKFVRFKVVAVEVYSDHVFFLVPSGEVICQDLFGIPRGIMGSLAFERCFCRQVAHFLTMCSICLHMPGQNNTSCGLCLDFSMPMTEVNA